MRTTLMLACFGMLASGARAAPVPAELVGPQKLPAKEVAAWKEAGWEVGWMGMGAPNWRGTTLEFGTTPDRFDTEIMAVPTFRIAEWRAGMLEQLPSPSRPFGL